MRLTRTLEERLVALYRQTKVVGGLFRSLGQEADAVGSCFALERRDVMSPLIRNLGAMLVKGATPVEVLKQYMAKGRQPDPRAASSTSTSATSATPSRRAASSARSRRSATWCP
jgi:TPP-dependent pyruvate/acetoin dehydrogenase alpha subunit